MKISIPFLALAITLIFGACSKDLGTTEVTYTKAHAVYGDIQEIRNTPLVEGAKSINNPGKIYVSDDFLLIGEETKGIHVLDNSNPENPQHISFLNVPGNKEFFVADGIIYAESIYDMLKIDISNLQSPVLAGRVKNYFESFLVGDEGDVVIGFEYELVTEKVENNDFSIWNSINNHSEVYFDYNRSVIPHSAVPASFSGSNNDALGSVNRIVKSNGHIYAINNEKLSVISDDHFSLSRTQYITLGMETIYPSDNKLFIGGSNSIEIVDISNPSSPRILSSISHSVSCDPVFPLEEVAYFTLRSGEDNCPGDVNSLITLDIRNASNPSILSEIDMLSPFGITLINDKLYVGEGEHGLKIFDASDRFNLSLIKFDQSIKAYDVIQHPSKSDVVLVAGPIGFGQYKVTENDEFSLIGWISY